MSASIPKTDRSLTWADALNSLVESGAFPGKPDAPFHRILLYGPPSTGKSAWAFHAPWPAKKKVERILLHSQMAPEDLIGGASLTAVNGATQSGYSAGIATRAMLDGSALVLDEIDKAGPDLQCALYAVLDDWDMAGVTLGTKRVKPATGYCVIATTNADPSVLPEALQTRFDLALYANRPVQAVLDAIAKTTSKGLASVLDRSYDRQPAAAWTPAISVRSFYALSRLAQTTGLEKAAELIFGEKGADILASAATAE